MWMHLLQDQNSCKIFQSAYIFFIPFEAAVILGKTKPVFLQYTWSYLEYSGVPNRWLITQSQWLNCQY